MTEPQYFRKLSRYLRATGVKVVGMELMGVGRDPTRVVRRALEESGGAGQQQRRRRSEDFDSIWCVFDVDQHNNIDEAIALAKRYGIEIAASNPCFELWLFWHYADCSVFVESQKLREMLTTHGVNSKSIPHGFRFESYPDAIERARSKSEEVPPSNPGSRVGALVQLLGPGAP